MLSRWALILALGCSVSLPGRAQEVGDKAQSEKDYVRVEIRGLLRKVEFDKSDTIFIYAHTKGLLPAEWPLSFEGAPELRKQAEKLVEHTVRKKGRLTGITVVVKGEFFAGPVGIVFVKELKPATPPKDKAPDAKKEQAELQGTWRIAESRAHGELQPGWQGIEFVFDGDRVSWLSPGEKDKRAFRFKLDATKQPNEVDLIATTGAYEGTTSPGIYKLEGDTLTLCVAVQWLKRSRLDGPRPKEFVSEAGSTVTWLLTLKRWKG